jgi:small subunit ribosomal protein S8
MIDLISDMLTRIRNSSLVKHNYTYIIYTKLNLLIIKLLINEGYIKNFEIIKENNILKFIKIILKYTGWWVKNSCISVIKRISKPGCRIYSSYKNLKKKLYLLKYNQGIAIISTSNGIMSHNQAIKFKKGGEILFYIE